MAISDKLNKLRVDIENAYLSINEKGGTIPTNKNTENLSSAINSITSETSILNGRIENYYLYPDNISETLDANNFIEFVNNNVELSTNKIIDIIPYNNKYVVLFNNTNDSGYAYVGYLEFTGSSASITNPARITSSSFQSNAQYRIAYVIKDNKLILYANTNGLFLYEITLDTSITISATKNMAESDKQYADTIQFLKQENGSEYYFVGTKGFGAIISLNNHTFTAGSYFTIVSGDAGNVGRGSSIIRENGDLYYCCYQNNTYKSYVKLITINYSTLSATLTTKLESAINEHWDYMTQNGNNISILWSGTNAYLNMQLYSIDDNTKTITNMLQTVTIGDSNVEYGNFFSVKERISGTSKHIDLLYLSNSYSLINIADIEMKPNELVGALYGAGYNKPLGLNSYSLGFLIPFENYIKYISINTSKGYSASTQIIFNKTDNYYPDNTYVMLENYVKEASSSINGISNETITKLNSGEIWVLNN